MEGDLFVVERDRSRFGKEEQNLVLAVPHVELDVVRRQQNSAFGDQLRGGHELVPRLTTTRRATVLVLIPAALPARQPQPSDRDDVVVFERIVFQTSVAQKAAAHAINGRPARSTIMISITLTRSGGLQLRGIRGYRRWKLTSIVAGTVTGLPDRMPGLNLQRDTASTAFSSRPSPSDLATRTLTARPVA